MPKTREQYMSLAEDSLYRHDAAAAAVYVSLAQMAEPAETVTVTGDDSAANTYTLDTPGWEIAGTGVTRPQLALAVWGDGVPDWGTVLDEAARGSERAHVDRDNVYAILDRVVDLLEQGHAPDRTLKGE